MSSTTVRRNTQLADLIMGSGLVSGVVKKPQEAHTAHAAHDSDATSHHASSSGAAQQPVLYHYLGGGGNATAQHNPRERAQSANSSRSRPSSASRPVMRAVTSARHSHPLAAEVLPPPPVIMHPSPSLTGTASGRYRDGLPQLPHHMPRDVGTAAAAAADDVGGADDGDATAVCQTVETLPKLDQHSDGVEADDDQLGQESGCAALQPLALDRAVPHRVSSDAAGGRLHGGPLVATASQQFVSSSSQPAHTAPSSPEAAPAAAATASISATAEPQQRGAIVDPSSSIRRSTSFGDPVQSNLMQFPGTGGHTRGGVNHRAALAKSVRPRNGLALSQGSHNSLGSSATAFPAGQATQAWMQEAPPVWTAPGFASPAGSFSPAMGHSAPNSPNPAHARSTDSHMAAAAATEGSSGVSIRGSSNLMMMVHGAARGGGGGGSAAAAMALAQGAGDLTFVVAELQRQLVESQRQLAEAQRSLAASEAERQELQTMAASALQGKDAEHLEMGRRHMKALKAAEAARDKAELAKHTTDKRVKQLEEEFEAFQGTLEPLSRQLTAAQQSLLLQEAATASAHQATEVALKALREEHALALKKQAADLAGQRQDVQGASDKMRGDLLKARQTVLQLSTTLSLFEEKESHWEVQRSDLQLVIQDLREQVQHERTSREAAEKQLDEAAAAAALSRQMMLSPGGKLNGRGAPSPLNGGGVGDGGDSSHKAVQRMKAEVATIREQYAKRLIPMDEALCKAETSMREGLVNMERLFAAFVARAANLLAGRVTGGNWWASGNAAQSFARPTSATTRQSVTPSAANRHGGGGGGAAAGAAVLNLNERLASENAGLLAELARFQSGRHPLLRKLGQTTLGAAEGSSGPHTPPAPQYGYAAYVNSKDGGAAAAAASAAAAATASPATAAAAAPSQQAAPPQAPAARAAREALAVAVREVLLANKQEMLPAIMTPEGWGGGTGGIGGGGGTGGMGGGSDTLSHSKAEHAISLAESNLKSRSQLMALQSEYLALRATHEADATAAATREAELSAAAAGSHELRAELAAARAQVAELKHQVESARLNVARISAAASSPGDQDAARINASLDTAQDELRRAKASLVTVRRDLEMRDQQCEELQAKVDKAEAQVREQRLSLSQQDEAGRRSRALLTQARALLHQAGVPFLEEDGPPPTAKEEPGAFKGMEAREREKELARLRTEAADAQAEVANLQKELKKLRTQVTKARESANEVAKAHAVELQAAVAAAHSDGAATRDALAATSAQLAAVTAEAKEAQKSAATLKTDLQRLQADAGYLRELAVGRRPKPKLGYAAAFNMSVSKAE